ncbi:MAG: hypothetical protein COA69_09480 [Robiginitomaculum sp.]|nr:MAG: hypothetical protein COA69_09480 [Robiginitomaculum sp.]
MMIRTNGNVLEMRTPNDELIYSIQKGGPNAEAFIRDLADQMRAALLPRIFPIMEGGTYVIPATESDETFESLVSALKVRGFIDVTLIRSDMAEAED